MCDVMWMINGRPMHYILDANGDPQPCDDLLVWAQWFETTNRIVSNDYDEGDPTRAVRVSTVFLGLDHNFSLDHKGPPVLWETMVFGGKLDGEMKRYSSKKDAAKGHQAMCRRVMAAHPGRGG